MPLEQIHTHALKAAAAAECAGQQGKFWQMHDALFTDQRRLEDASLAIHARDIDLDAAKFEQCLAGDVMDQVRQNVSRARGLAVSSTPTVFLGTVLPDGSVKVAQRLVGAVSLSKVTESIQALLTAAAPQ
jgi:protein-disulfide isomerase